MKGTISRETREEILRLVSENPAISDRKIARILDISRDSASKYRKLSISEPAPVKAVLTSVEEHFLKFENTQLKRQIKDLLDDRVKTDKLAEFSAIMADAPVKIPEWSRKAADRKTDSAVPFAFLSDWHLDEVVNRAQVSGVNEFNRKIAEVRCENFFDNTVRLTKHFISGIRYDGIYMPMGGDLFSGNIHEELKQTNEATIIDSVLYWVPRVASGIQYLADSFGHVHIPCVVGNHGRLTHKPVAKFRAQDNFDYLFYNMIAMHLRADDRITWDISAAADCMINVLDTAILLTHGDQFRGGSGIAGLLSPLLLGDHRKRKRQAAIRRPYDWMCYGHWHSLVLGVRGLLGNGSLKGYDEYAMVSNFDYEPPQQALWLVQPRKGVTGRWPIHVLGDNEDYSL